MCKITEITNGVQVVSEEGSMIHEDSLQRPEDVITRGRAARDVQKMFDAATLN